MKILLANKYFYLNGGSETVFFQERDFLIRSGHEVVDFSMHNERNNLSHYSSYFVGSRDYHRESGWLQRLKSATSLIHSFEAVKNISRLIETEKPDIVHCHNIYHQLTPSIIGAANKLGVPVVLTLHDYKPVCPTYLRLREGNVCSECLNGNFRNVVKHRCAEGSYFKSTLLYAEASVQRVLGNYEKVSKVIAPSQFMADSVEKRFSNEKITVIHNGIDLNSIKPSNQDSSYALFLGRLSKEKGLASLIEAYKKHNLNFPLKVCGEGPLDISSLKPTANIEFLGYQSGKNLKSIIDNASFVIVPSEWYENCPMSILEAMAYSKAVIAAKIGGIPELISDKESGLLFESGNITELAECIQKLALDKQLRLKMGINGRRSVESKFSLETHNSKLLNVYNELS